METRAEVDQSGEIMKLAHYCPWKEHLYELEKELSLSQPIKFCLYEVCTRSNLGDSRARATQNSVGTIGACLI